MTRKEIVLETYVYLPFNHLMGLVAQGYFIEFSCHGSLNYNNNNNIYSTANGLSPGGSVIT